MPAATAPAIIPRINEYEVNKLKLAPVFVVCVKYSMFGITGYDALSGIIVLTRYFVIWSMMRINPVIAIKIDVGKVYFIEKTNHLTYLCFWINVLNKWLFLWKMSLTDNLNACLKSLKHSVKRNDTEEIKGLCNNLNHMLSMVYDYSPPSRYLSYSGLRIGVCVDEAIVETCDDDEVYRPTAEFWRRVGTPINGNVPSQFNIHQPALSADGEHKQIDVRAYKYHLEFIYTAPHTVECRLYISERQISAQQGDDVVLPESLQPCLILYPHEIIEFAENGPREVTTFSFPQQS
jgi:hypothetical protein